MARRVATLRVVVGLLLGCASSALAEPPSPPATQTSAAVAKTQPALETHASTAAQPRALESTASSPWSACVASERMGTVRVMRCPGMEVRFMRTGVLSGERGIAAAFGSGRNEVVPPTQWLNVGKRRVPFAVRTAGVASVYAAAPLDDALMVCMGDRALFATQCEPRVKWVTEHGLPPGISFPPVKLEFMGVALHVPAGCQMTGPERITCGNVSLDWRAGLPPHDPWLALESSYRAAGLTIVKSEPSECSIAGSAGQGKALKVSGPAGTLTLAACLVDRGGTRGIAVCIGAAPAPGVRYPAPCEQVFGVTAP